jgi:alpha-1,2-mannosyltransferase
MLAGMLNVLRSFLDRSSPRRVFLVVMAPLFILYLATASRALPYHVDALTNALTAWELGSQGTVYVDESPELTAPGSFGDVAWFVRTPAGHVVSQYPPGAALIAAPLYRLYPSSHVARIAGNNNPDIPGVTVQLPSLVPAAVAAALATAVAIALIALTLLEFVPSRSAVAGAYIAGLGTGAWAVASNALWQHGPAMLWIAFALYLTARRHLLGAGSAFGMAILTRPPLALVAAAVGLTVGLSRRSMKPVLTIGVGSSIGLGALVAYNWVVFGTPSISGGYGGGFTSNALHSSLGWYLQNILGSLVDPARGLLVWAPFLIILIPGLRKGRRAAPAWAKGAAVGGLLYLLLQLKANRFSGGGGFFAYRYPLEALTAAAPLLAYTWRDWVSKTPLRRRLFWGSVVLSIVGQALGAVLY